MKMDTQNPLGWFLTTCSSYLTSLSLNGIFCYMREQCDFVDKNRFVLLSCASGGISEECFKCDNKLHHDFNQYSLIYRHTPGHFNVLNIVNKTFQHHDIMCVFLQLYFPPYEKGRIIYLCKIIKQ